MTQEQVINGLRDLYGSEFTTPDVRAFCSMNDIAYSTVTKKLKAFKVTKGKWNLEVTQSAVEDIERSFAKPSVLPAQVQNLVPVKDENFVKFGPFADIKRIIQSKQFYPAFITGLSGNGKTFSVEQACAQLNRELIRVNITIETDEDDLIGGFRLVDGNTVWHNGPVIESLERGAILLLDEIDLASNKILCLQSILEGKGVFLKKIGKWVKPAAGFNVIATANTKGKGSDDGRFIAATIIDEAFLERFTITMEQPYPSLSIEKKIVIKHMEKYGKKDLQFAEMLSQWSETIRKTYEDDGIDELISTRRLCHITQTYAIFDDRMKAIELCVNRFDNDTKEAFIDLYSKVDLSVNDEVVENPDPQVDSLGDILDAALENTNV